MNLTPPHQRHGLAQLARLRVAVQRQRRKRVALARTVTGDGQGQWPIGRLQQLHQCFQLVWPGGEARTNENEWTAWRDLSQFVDQRTQVFKPMACFLNAFQFGVAKKLPLQLQDLLEPGRVGRCGALRMEKHDGPFAI